MNSICPVTGPDFLRNLYEFDFEQFPEGKIESISESLFRDTAFLLLTRYCFDDSCNLVQVDYLDERQECEAMSTIMYPESGCIVRIETVQASRKNYSIFYTWDPERQAVVEFSTRDNEDLSIIEINADGRIAGQKYLWMDKSYWKTRRNENGKMTSLGLTDEGTGLISMQIEFQYGPYGDLIRMSEYSNPGRVLEKETQLIHEYDDQGNWITEKTVGVFFDRDQYRNLVPYTVKRDIEYRR